MKLFLKEIPQGKTVKGYTNGEPCYEGLVFLSPVGIESELFLKGRDCRVTARCRTVVEVECSKCLERYAESVDILRVIVIGEYDREANDHGVDDFYNASELEGVFDLFEYFSEEILIGQPISNRCSDDCKGMCLLCGKNLNKEVCNCD